MELQAIERALIASMYPRCLNSAPGGSRAIPDLSRLPPGTPLPPGDHDPGLDEINVKITQLIVDMAAQWESGGATKIHPQALETVVQAAKVRRTDGGHVVLCRVAKDITHEAFHYRRDGLDYHGRLAGPGPALGVLLKLHAHAAPTADTLSWEEIVSILGPFIDLWSVCLEHKDIISAVGWLWEYLRIVRPLVVDVQSAKVSNLLLTNVFAHVQRNSAGGWTCPPIEDDDWEDIYPERWMFCVGEIILINIDEDTFALAVMSVSLDGRRAALTVVPYGPQQVQPGDQ